MTAQWLTVDEGWGRRAADYATLLEPASCREYLAMHRHLDVGEGDRLLDVACGSGLALELAAIRGAAVSGIDASSRLAAIARDRVPGADVRVGDMAALPWDDDCFDVVTSFRGLWATTREALAEARRVLRRRLTGMALRVPVSNVSIADLTCELDTATSYADICAAARAAADGPMHGIVGYTEEQVVSTDFRGETRTCVFDASAGIQLDPTFVKLMAWYDNECGYSAKLLDLAMLTANRRAEVS